MQIHQYKITTKCPIHKGKEKQYLVSPATSEASAKKMFLNGFPFIPASVIKRIEINETLNKG